MPDLKRKYSGLALKLAAAFLVGGLMILFTVPLIGPCWHLLFGDKISYAGWSIPVPKGFYPRNSRDGPTMWKLNLGIPLLPVPYGHVSLFFRPGQVFLFSQHYRRFAAAVSADAASGGYAVLDRTVTAAGAPAYCVQLDRQAGEPNSLVRCAVEGTGIAVFYEGDRKYLPDFYFVLEHVSGTQLTGAKSKR